MGASRPHSPPPPHRPPHRSPAPPPPKPPPTDAQPHRAAPPYRPLHPPRRRPPSGLPYPRAPAPGRKQTCLHGNVSAGHPRADSLLPIAVQGASGLGVDCQCSSRASPEARPPCLARPPPSPRMGPSSHSCRGPYYTLHRPTQPHGPTLHPSLLFCGSLCSAGCVVTATGGAYLA